MKAKPLIPVGETNQELEDKLLQASEEIDRLQQENKELQQYIEKLENDKEDTDDLLDRIEELEDQLCSQDSAKAFLEELIYDRYMHINKDYKTLVQVLDRAEFILKYGD